MFDLLTISAASAYGSNAAFVVLTLVFTIGAIALQQKPLPWSRVSDWTAYLGWIVVGVLIAGFVVSRFWLERLVVPIAAVLALMLALRAWALSPLETEPPPQNDSSPPKTELPPPKQSAILDSSIRGDLRNVALVKNEIATAVRRIHSHIGRTEHWEPIDDSNWVAHRNSLASIPGSSSAFDAASEAWDGFHRLNGLLDDGSPMSDNWLRQLTEKGQDAVDALTQVEQGINGRARTESQPTSPTRGAEIVAKATGYSGSSRGVEFPITIRNASDVVARDLVVWIALAPVDGHVENAIGVSPKHEVGPLTRDDGAVEFKLEQQGASAGGGVPRDGLIIASWKDAAGDHLEAVGKLSVFL